MFVNFAHRGASTYAPENTLASFCLGLEMGANGIETDIKKSKDGILVLFHDDTLTRMTGEQGSANDYTYDALHEMNVTLKGSNAIEKIVRFEDFARYFGPKDLTFEIELKDEYIEGEVVDMLKKFHMEQKSYITSFNAESLRRVKKYDPSIRTCFIAHKLDQETYALIHDIKADASSVLVDNLTPDIVKEALKAGLRLHAWGIKDETDMKKALDCGVMGMTINFPDKLTKALKERG